MGYLVIMKLTKIKSLSAFGVFLYHIFHSYSAAYSSITIVQAGTRLLVYLVVAKLLGPQEYAAWPLVLAIMSYSMLIGVGVMPALGNVLPVYKGAGRERRYRLILGSSLVFLSVFWVCIILIAVGILLNNFDNRFYAYGVLLALLQSVIQFFLKIHRSNLDFKRLFWATFLSVVFLPFGLLLLVKIPNLNLFCIIFAISLLVQLFWVFDLKSIKEANYKGYRVTFRIVFHLQKIGLLLLVSGSIVTFLFSMDRWFVNSFYSTSLLGQYGFAVFGAMGIQLLISSIGQVYYPTIAHGYGASNKLSSQKKNIFIFLILTLSLIIILILSVWFLLPTIVARWLPEYQEGLNAAKWMVLGGVALPFATLGSILLQVKKILWRLVAGQSLGLFLGACAIYYGCNHGDDSTLAFVGMSVGVSYVLYSLCVVGASTLYFWPYFLKTFLNYTRSSVNYDSP